VLEVITEKDQRGQKAALMRDLDLEQVLSFCFIGAFLPVDARQLASGLGQKEVLMKDLEQERSFFLSCLRMHACVGNSPKRPPAAVQLNLICHPARSWRTATCRACRFDLLC